MNIQKYRDRKEKAFRKECIKEYKRLYSQILGYMNDGYGVYSFKMKCIRAETVAILALLCSFDWLDGKRYRQYDGDVMKVHNYEFYKFSWK